MVPQSSLVKLIQKEGLLFDTKDKKLKENYIARHESDLDTLDPKRARISFHVFVME